MTNTRILGAGEGTEPVSHLLSLLITVTSKITINHAKVKMISPDRELFSVQMDTAIQLFLTGHSEGNSSG